MKAKRHDSNSHAGAARARRVEEPSERRKPACESRKPEEAAGAPAENPYRRLMRRIRQITRRDEVL